MKYFLLSALLLSAFLYYMNGSGIAVVKSIRAVVFAFRPQKDKDTARVNTCTGWARHRLRLDGAGAYEFIFDANLSDGEARVLLLDGNKQALLTLGSGDDAGTVELSGTERYTLRWEFQKATGTCELRWTLAK